MSTCVLCCLYFNILIPDTTSQNVDYFLFFLSIFYMPFTSLAIKHLLFLRVTCLCFCYCVLFSFHSFQLLYLSFTIRFWCVFVLQSFKCILCFVLLLRFYLSVLIFILLFFFLLFIHHQYVNINLQPFQNVSNVCY